MTPRQLDQEIPVSEQGWRLYDMLSVTLFLNEGISSMVARRVVGPVVRKVADLYGSRAIRKKAVDMGEDYAGHEIANRGTAATSYGINPMHLDRLENSGIAGKIASSMYVEDMSPLVAAGQMAGEGLKKMQPQMQAVGNQVKTPLQDIGGKLRTSLQGAGNQVRETLSSWGGRLTQHYDHQ